MKENELVDNMIEIKGLTKREVWKIVNEWYTNGMYSDLLHDESGRDLEEICEHYLYCDNVGRNFE